MNHVCQHNNLLSCRYALRLGDLRHCYPTMKTFCFFLLVVALPVFGQSLPYIQCNNATTNTVGFITAMGSFCFVPPRSVQVLPNPKPTNSLWVSFYVADSVSGALLVGFTTLSYYGYPSNSIVLNVLQQSSGYSESAMLAGFG